MGSKDALAMALSSRDEESSLSYHGARYYSPWLCRWLSIDPLALTHMTRFLQQGVHLNLYAYVSGNPTNLVDLSGLDAKNFAIVLSPDVIEPKAAEETKKYAESLKGYTVLQVKSLEDLVALVKQASKRGKKGLSIAVPFLPSTVNECWSVVPLADEFLLVSRQNRQLPRSVIEKINNVLASARPESEITNEPTRN